MFNMIAWATTAIMVILTGVYVYGLVFSGQG
jgi:hypothetical protein